MARQPRLRPKSPPAPFQIEQHHPNVHSIYFDDVRAGWEQWVLLSGDRHHDSVYCDWDFERCHLEQARERQALIIDVGDIFDVMQGKWDPRSDLKDLRPKYKTTQYLDAVVKDAADFYGPYARHFAVIGRGNHDQSILRRHGTDLVSNLVHRLCSEHGGNCFAGGYGGWVRFCFTLRKTVRTSRRLHYFHGAGADAPVTLGTIQTNRQAVYLGNPDIVVNGHNHNHYVLALKRIQLTDAGEVRYDLMHFVRTPTYADYYRAGEGGWQVETGKPPKPKGAVWMRFFVGADGEIATELTAAIR